MRYTDEQIKFILSLSGMKRKEISERFEEKFGIRKSGDTLVMTARAYGNMGSSKDYFTPEEDAFLLEWRSQCFVEELTERLNKRFNKNRTVASVDNRCKRIGARGAGDGRFKKGFVPWHKGLSKEEFKSHYTEESFAKGKFKPGEHSIALKYKVGDEVVRDPYVYVKVTDSLDVPPEKQWEMKHRYIWKLHHGEIPENGSIIFLDGNKRNFDIDNLALVTRSQMGRMSTHKLYSEKREITSAGIMLCKLMEATDDARKEKKDG